MKLKEFKDILANNSGKQFLIKLPNEETVPQSFHITEVGLVTKEFIDCGGKVHKNQTCQLQVWIGPDVDHRLETGKMLSILKLSESIVTDDSVDLEIEYESNVISQYPVSHAMVSKEGVTIVLSLKHTDCLAKDICIPVVSGSEESCCGGGGCC